MHDECNEIFRYTSLYIFLKLDEYENGAAGCQSLNAECVTISVNREEKLGG